MKSILIAMLLVASVAVAAAPGASATTVCASGDAACVCATTLPGACYDSNTGEDCFVAAGLDRDQMTGIGC